MKKTIMSTLLTTLVFTSSLFFIHQAPLRYGHTVFSMTDKKGDDNGAGKIQYPTQINKEEGLFDITKFEVKKDKNEIEFTYELANINNKYNNSNKFSNVLIDTYISVGEEGLNTTLEYGAAITFNEDYPWMYHIRITPEEYYIEKLVDITNKQTEKIECEFALDDTTLLIKTDAKNINEDLKKSKYYVFTGGYDILGSDNYRKVVDEESEWNFYGGINSLYQPNVLDVVSPIQKKMLVYFMPPIYAALSPVYNQSHQFLFKKELLYLIALILASLKYLSIYKEYTLRKKDNVIKNNTDIDKAN